MNKNFTSRDFLENFLLFRKYVLLYVALFFVIFLFAFYNINAIVNILAKPLFSILNCSNVACSNLIYTSFEEKFITFVNLAFFVALLLSLPIALLLLFTFAFPALYSHEKVIYIIATVCFLFSFYLGVYVAYKYFLIKIWSFFINFANTDAQNNVSFYPKVKEFFTFTKKVLLASGLIFEMPFVLVFLGFFKIIHVNALKQFRKYVYFACFVFGAIVTPPDPFSQIFLALFLIICYEFAIFTIIILTRVFKNK